MPYSSYDIVVDVGSGSGGFTKLLATSVPHKRVIGIDLDPKMIAYSDTHNNDDTIEYVLQDMSVADWTQLTPRLRELESKVDLIFSNDTLTNIADKYRLLNIIWRLLARDGIMHANIPLLPDLNKKRITGYNQCYKSIDQQLDDWRDGLKVNQFVVKDFTVFEFIITVKRQAIIGLLNIFIQTNKKIQSIIINLLKHFFLGIIISNNDCNKNVLYI